MKNDKKNGLIRGWLCRTGGPINSGNRLVAAGYPKFLFRLAAARRAWTGAPRAPRRHD